jgi:predicted nucleic acid-binding Zn ribbon protein
MRPIGQVMSGAIADILRAAPLSNGKVEFAWKAAVGPALQRVTAVRLEGGVLLVDAASAQWAREVKRSSRVILARLQAFLGDDAIKSITIRTGT